MGTPNEDVRDTLVRLGAETMFQVMYEAAQQHSPGPNTLVALLAAKGQAIQTRELCGLVLPENVTVKRRLDGQYEVVLKAVSARMTEPGDVGNVVRAMATMLETVRPFRRQPDDGSA